MNKDQKQTHPEVGEDATQYGEFVSTYFAWIPLPKQKDNAEKMAQMTKRRINDDIQIHQQGKKSNRNSQ